ncbi:MAG TPA: hypothetical protein VGC99_13535 [Candidatus Tectomicrobia bacterium]
MTINRIRLTEARWRRLAPELRAMLRQVLGGKPAIINRPVLDIARALCAHGAYELAFALYQHLDGQPPTPYAGCGLGLLMDLRSFMGEDPAEIGSTILL